MAAWWRWRTRCGPPHSAASRVEPKGQRGGGTGRRILTQPDGVADSAVQPRPPTLPGDGGGSEQPVLRDLASPRLPLQRAANLSSLWSWHPCPAELDPSPGGRGWVPWAACPGRLPPHLGRQPHLKEIQLDFVQQIPCISGLSVLLHRAIWGEPCRAWQRGPRCSWRRSLGRLCWAAPAPGRGSTKEKRHKPPKIVVSRFF